MKPIFWNIALAISFTLCLPQLLGARQTSQRSVKVEFRLAEDNPAKGLTEAAVTGTNEKVYLHERAVITGEDIAEAQAIRVQYADSYEVLVTFTREGAEKMASATGNHLGKKMAIIIDNVVISAPTINSRITDKASIAGVFTKEETERIAEALNRRERNQ